MTLCPGKSFALDFLFTVGIKIVCELYLSFDGFIDNAPDNSTALGGKSTFFTVSSWLAACHPFTKSQYISRANYDANFFSRFTNL